MTSRFNSNVHSDRFIPTVGLSGRSQHHVGVKTYGTSNLDGTQEFFLAMFTATVLCAVLMTLFSIARNKFTWIYTPRSNTKIRGNDVPPPPTPARDLFGWISQTMHVSDEEIFETCGLDALMLLKFFAMCIEIFGTFSMFAVFVLIPINAMDVNSLSDGFPTLSMSNITPGSDRMWVHLLLAYGFTFLSFYHIFNLWQDYVVLRHRFLRREQMKGRYTSLYVRNIPRALKTGGALTNYFRTLYPSVFHRANMAYDLSELTHVLHKRDEAFNNLEKVYGEFVRDGERPSHSPGICLASRDAIEYWAEQLGHWNEILYKLQREDHPIMDRGFVTFSSTFMTTVATQVENNDQPFEFDARAAPEPRDVDWTNVFANPALKLCRLVVVGLMLFFLLFFFTVPVALVSSFTNIQAMSTTFPVLEPLLQESPAFRGFLEGFLPSLAFRLFMLSLPYILMHIIKYSAVEAYSWQQQALLDYYFIFLVVDFFIMSLISNSIFAVLSDILEDPGALFNLLGQSVPMVSTFFGTYILLVGLVGFPIRLLQLQSLIFKNFQKNFNSLTRRDIKKVEKPPCLNYGEEYPEALLVFVVASTYCVIAPIIIPFAYCFFSLGYLANRYLILYVYVPRFETGGTFWPQVFRKLIVAFGIAQLALIGIFGIKYAPVQGALAVPLPVLTFFFFTYVETSFLNKSRYLPIKEANEVDEFLAKVEWKRKSNQISSSTHQLPVYVHPALNAAPKTIDDIEDFYDELVVAHVQIARASAEDRIHREDTESALLKVMRC